MPAVASAALQVLVAVLLLPVQLGAAVQQLLRDVQVCAAHVGTTQVPPLHVRPEQQSDVAAQRALVVKQLARQVNAPLDAEPQYGAAPQQPPLAKPALHDAPVHERQLPD